MERKIALFDMDDTLCDYRGKLMKDLSYRLPSEELEEIDLFQSRLSKNIRNEIKKIRCEKGWWKNLPMLEDGLALWKFIRELGFETHLATKGPYHDTNGWKEKFEWQKKYLPEAEGITITLDKSNIFGDLLVDDWPPYIKKWLEKNPQGLAIIPKRSYNLGVILKDRIKYYNGNNFEELKDFLSQ